MAAAGDDPAGTATAEQLGEVVHVTDEMPLGGDLVPAPQSEAAEAHGLLDLADDRFDDDRASGSDRDPSSSCVCASCAGVPMR